MLAFMVLGAGIVALGIVVLPDPVDALLVTLS